MLNNIQELTENLSNDRLSAEKLKEIEIGREQTTFGTVSDVCRYTNEWVKFHRLPIAHRSKYEDEVGYDPELYLYGRLKQMYLRSLAGHGTEAKAVSILLGEEVILDHQLTRTADMPGGMYSSNKLQETFSIQEKEEGVSVHFENLVFYPKGSGSSPEGPGYYEVEILLSKDPERNKAVMEMADERYLELRKLAENP
jgi:hypothetical protein